VRHCDYGVALEFNYSNLPQKSADSILCGDNCGEIAMNSKKKGNSLVNYAERRASPRLPPEAFPTLNGAFLSNGAIIQLIDISTGGALVESEERLKPDTKICLQICTTEGTFTLLGRILRSTISRLEGGPCYRSRIAFDDKFPLQAASSSPSTTEDIEAATGQSITPTIPPSQLEPPQPSAANAANPEQGETLTLKASMTHMPPSLQHYFEFIKINNW
jgi:hypothetical protein